MKNRTNRSGGEQKLPSEKILQSKKEAVAALTEKMKGSVAGVLVDYKGINVADDTALRRELRQAGVHYAVYKNSMVRFAAKDAGLEDLTKVLEGTTAVAISESDPVAAAKIICKYAEKSKTVFNVKAGYVDGGVLDADEVQSLAKLPSREELVAKALAGFNAPITGFVNVLNGNIRGLVVALNAIAEKQGA